ncbi:MAG: hypothetical protein LBF87_08370 [Treponema sp.]|jgi:hypothetical protein|nr:hypothetical protein [Treponema sp.]
MNKRISYACVALMGLFASLLFAQVNTNELQQGQGSIEFYNYTGPVTRIDTVAQIRNIGYEQGLAVRRGVTRSGATNRYFVIHSVTAPEGERMDADIFGLGAGVGVDHIRNLRLIIQGYLEGAYNYSVADARLLAQYITIYNAFYRGNWNFFSSRYKQAVLGNLSADRVGLSVRFDEWPGRTLIVIPLGNASPGSLSAIDTSAVSDEGVLEELRRDPNQGLDVRKEMVELKEREADEAEALAADLREAIAAEEARIAAERRRAQQTSPEEARRIEDELAAREKALEEQRRLADEAERMAERKMLDAQSDREDIAIDQNGGIAAEAARRAEAARQAEIARQAAEEAARQAEIARQAAEEAARQAEIAQQAAEEAARQADAAQQAEIARQAAEEAARQAEIAQQAAENVPRQGADAAAQQTEIARQAAEEAARQAEIARQAAEEATRLAAEAEAARQAELAQQAAEEAARQVEIAQGVAENLAPQNEAAAQQAEIARQAAEEAARQAEIAQQAAENVPRQGADAAAQQTEIARQAAEEAARQAEIARQAAEEATRLAAEADAAQQAAEEAAAQQAEEEAARQAAAEEAARQAEEAAAQQAEIARQAEEAAALQAEEEAAAQQAAAEEAARQAEIARQAAKEAAQQAEIAQDTAENITPQNEAVAQQAEIARQAAEEAARQAEIAQQAAENVPRQGADAAAQQTEIARQAAEEAARQAEIAQQAAEEATRLAAEAEAARQAEEEAAQQAAAEEAARQAEEEAARQAAAGGFTANESAGGTKVVMIELTQSDSPLGVLIELNLASGTRTNTSSLASINARSLTVIGEGEEQKIFATLTLTENVVQLIQIDQENMGVSAQVSDNSIDSLYVDAPLWVRETNIYTIVSSGGALYLARFDTAAIADGVIPLAAKSATQVHPYATVSFQGDIILIQSANGQPAMLNVNDLSERF